MCVSELPYSKGASGSLSEALENLLRATVNNAGALSPESYKGQKQHAGCLGWTASVRKPDPGSLGNAVAWVGACFRRFQASPLNNVQDFLTCLQHAMEPLEATT